VVNVVTEDLAQQMNICSTDVPEGVDKLEMAGLEPHHRSNKGAKD